MTRQGMGKRCCKSRHEGQGLWDPGPSNGLNCLLSPLEVLEAQLRDDLMLPLSLTACPR
jgi:hypothetical protein